MPGTRDAAAGLSPCLLELLELTPGGWKYTTTKRKSQTQLTRCWCRKAGQAPKLEVGRGGRGRGGGRGEAHLGSFHQPEGTAHAKVRGQRGRPAGGRAGKGAPTGRAVGSERAKALPSPLAASLTFRDASRPAAPSSMPFSGSPVPPGKSPGPPGASVCLSSSPCPRAPPTFELCPPPGTCFGPQPLPTTSCPCSALPLPS